MIQIVDDVVDMFRADAEADRALVNALILEFGGTQLTVCRAGRMNHERLHVGDVRQQREDLQMIDEGLRAYMLKVYNYMGIGLVAVVNGKEAEAAVKLFEKLGERAWIIGELVKGQHEVVIG